MTTDTDLDAWRHLLTCCTDDPEALTTFDRDVAEFEMEPLEAFMEGLPQLVWVDWKYRAAAIVEDLPDYDLGFEVDLPADKAHEEAPEALDTLARLLPEPWRMIDLDLDADGWGLLFKPADQVDAILAAGRAVGLTLFVRPQP